MKKPLVTIAITCYNYAEYVAEAIESALNQSYKNLEVIIINDGSTDDSDTVIRKLIKKYPSAKYIDQKNHGVVYTRNRGLAEATGEYLMFLDADDKIPSNYIASNLHYAEENSVDIVSTDFMLFGAFEERVVLPEFKLEYMKNGNIVHMGSLMKKSSIGEAKFDESLSRRSHEDWDFFLGLALAGTKIAKNPDTYLYYRQHSGSRNNTSHNDAQDEKKKFEYAEVYRDILHKYSLNYHDDLHYLSGIGFANHLATVYRNTIPVMEAEAEQHRLYALQLESELTHIKASKAYRVGTHLMRLPKKAKTLILRK